MGNGDPARGQPPANLHQLAEQCLVTRNLVEAVGDPVMRAAIDLLLAEIGRALAQAPPPDGAATS